MPIRRNTRGRYSPYLAAARIGAHKARSSMRSRTSFRPEPDSANVTSGHFDQKQLYRRKPLTGRRKRVLRRKRSFARKVTKVAEEMFGIQRILIQDSTVTSSLISNQGFLTDFNLLFGDGLAGDRDFRQISSTYSAFGTINSNTPMFWRSAFLDWTLTADDITISSAVVFVDLYEFICKKDVPVSVAPTLNALFSTVAAPTGATGTLTPTHYGFDPFTSYIFTEYFTVTKVTQVQIPAGSSVRGRISKRVMRKVSPDDWVGKLAVKGISSGMLAIFYGSPNSGSGSPEASTLRLNYVKQINVQINNVLPAGSGFVPP